MTFKHEDEVDGMAVGPVAVYEDADADPSPQPFDPDREVRWVTLAQARSIAAERGVTLDET